MPNDYITINAAVKELDKALKGGRIDKIQQPDNNDIILTIYANNKNHTLILSSHPQYARIHITNNHFESPINALSFCMHLRKYIQGGNIVSVKMLNDDRIVAIYINSRTELKDEITLTLLIEIMSRYSNIALINNNNIITDCIKHISLDEGNDRILMPNIPYVFPQNDKIKISDKEKIKDFLNNCSYDDLARLLSTAVSGISYNTAEIIINLSGYKDKDFIKDKKQEFIENVLKNIAIFLNINDTEKFNPCNSFDSNNEINDFSILPYNDNYKATNSLNEAMDLYFSSKSNANLLKNEQSRLTGAVNRSIKKYEHKLSLIKERIIESKDAEKIKNYADAIICNQNRIEKGAEKVSLVDYNDEKMRNIEVPLDVMLSPMKNAEKYYNKYNKLKRTYKISLEQEKECNDYIEYLNSIIYSIKSEDSLKGLSDIEKELTDIEILPKKASKTNKKEKSKPYVPVLMSYFVNGFAIKVGKNNLQNDYVTFKYADINDLWMHSKNYHGSHLIISSNNTKIPESVMVIAAEIAAFYCQASASSKVEIDYTIRKNVKHHPSNKLGLVTYTNYKTLLVSPNQHKEFLVKKD